jgi:hypothetical protein
VLDNELSKLDIVPFRIPGTRPNIKQNVIVRVAKRIAIRYLGR